MKKLSIAKSAALLSLATFTLTSAVMVGAGAGDDDVPDVGEPGGPSSDLDPDELAQWLRGREVFDRPFHRSNGLGAPEMNADSCRGCHQDPAIGGAGGLELNVSRMGLDHAGQGPFEDVPGGQGLSKFYPPFFPGREEAPPECDVFEQRQTPSLFGGGFVDSIPGDEILANQDPDDLDGDGIRGRARLIDTGGPQLEVGRFGWKAQVPRLFDFVNDAMGGELGITTPDNGRGFSLLSDADAVADPELALDEFDDIAFFLQNLAAPKRGGSTDPLVEVGADIFDTVGCAKCHIPVLQGTDGPVPLYSNLLLHNVMPNDFRGMEEPDAPSGFFKTPPLWGISHTAPYMHDGRAENLLDAISAHHGEAQAVREAFEAMTRIEQGALLIFLEDL